MQEKMCLTGTGEAVCLLQNIQQDEHNLKEIIESFEYRKLTSCNMMEVSAWFEILYYFTKSDTFYKELTRITATVDFILINLNFFLKQSNNKLLCDALGLLNAIFCKVIIMPSIKDCVGKISRVAEIMLNLMRSSYSNDAKLQGCRVLCYLIQMRQEHKETILFEAVAEASKNIMKMPDAFSEVCLLTKFRIRTGMLNDSEEVFEYILKNHFEFFRKGPIPEQTAPFLECIFEMYNICTPSIISKSLFCIANKLTEFCCHPLLMNLARCILCRVIMDFAVIMGVPLLCNLNQLFVDAKQLPNDVNAWPVTGSDIFFILAYLQYEYSTIIWETKKFLGAVTHRLSFRSFIPPAVLKSISYLFPLCVVNTELENDVNILIGSETLIKHIKYSSVLNLIFTPHQSQLSWILKSNTSMKLKFNFIELWLNTTENDSDLAMVIARCKAGNILLEYLIRNCRGEKCRRVSKIVGLIKDRNLSCSVTTALFQHVSNVPIFCNLMLSNPATPKRTRECILMCSIMGAILPFLRDAEVFRVGCLYSCKLLELMQNEPEAFLEFCKNIANIRVILKAAIDHDNDLGLAAVKLLRTLLWVQIKTKLSFENGITADLKGLLGDNKERTVTSLNLLKRIVLCRYRNFCKLYLNFDDDFVMGLYLKLHEYARSDFAGIVCDCMMYILLDNNQLAFLAVTSVFMEMQCEFPNEYTYTKKFIMFFGMWLQILKMPGQFPSRLVEHFIMRAPRSVKEDVLNLKI